MHNLTQPVTNEKNYNATTAVKIAKIGDVITFEELIYPEGTHGSRRRRKSKSCATGIKITKYTVTGFGEKYGTSENYMTGNGYVRDLIVNKEVFEKEI